MPNTLEHEQMRWDSMTAAQLATRLNRIRDPLKFNNFLACARNARNAYLYTGCLQRMEEFGVGVTITRDASLDLRTTGLGSAEELSDGVTHVTDDGHRLNARADDLSFERGVDPHPTVDEESLRELAALGARNGANSAAIKKPIHNHRIIRISGSKKRKRALERKTTMRDLRNELDIEAPRAKGAYLEDAPDVIWNDAGWVLEDKEDAMRCTMQLGPERSLLVGRNRKDFLKGVEKAGSFMSLDHKNPVLAFEVKSKEFDGTILDGELTETFKKVTKKTLLAGKGIDTKLGVMEHDKYTVERAAIGDHIGYVVWDCLFYKGVDIRDRPLWKRRKAAEHVIEKIGDPRIRIILQVEATEDNMQAIFDRGKEGAIAKNVFHTIPVDHKVHSGYWKLKGDDKRTVDGFITGVQEALGGGSGVKGIKPKPTGKAASFTICMLDINGEPLEVCKMKGNLTDDMVDNGYREFHRFKDCVVEMKVSGWDGIRFRWPRFYRWREDKTPADCTVLEQIGRVTKKSKKRK